MSSWEKFSRIVVETKASKKLDPVGKEDADVNNDGVSDSSDSYLRKRRNAVGAAIAADKKKKVEEAKQLDPVGQEDKDIDNDGDSDRTDSYLRNRRKVRSKIIQREETEQIDEVLGGQSGDGYIGHPRLGIKNPMAKKQTSTNTSSNTGLAGRLGNRASQMDDAMKQLRQSYEPEGDLVDEGKADKKLPEHKRSAARLARYDNPSGALALGGGQQRARRSEHEERRGVKKEGYVDEAVKGESSERRKDLAAERKRGIKPLSAKKGKEYSDFHISSMAYAKRAKMGEEVEQLDEMPYQVYGSPDGKSEKKIGKLVKSKKYAHDRAEELADTHKETGGKYRVQKEENEIDEGMSMKDFKANRKKVQRAAATADARKRGHEGKTWADSGRTYSADEAKFRRANMTDYERQQRYQTAEDPDSDNADTYPASKTKDPKKLRKQKAMGEGYLAEKSLSRAQQRFMGMVYDAKKGETPASPEVAKAAEGMSKKAARDFAKTKHSGLPEKKEEVKEELSLVQRIIEEVLNEAPKGTIIGGKSKAKKYKAVAKQAKLAAAVNKVMKGDSDSEETPKESEEKPTKKQSKRGKSDPSALARRATVAGAAKVKAEREKTKRQRERQQYEKERRSEKSAQKQKKLEAAYKEKRIKSAQQQSDKEQSEKDQTRKEIKSAVKQGIGSIRTGYVSDKESAGKTADQMLSNVGSIAGGILKTGKGIISAKMNARKRKREDREKSQRHEKIRSEMSKEEFSNWREEFILEVDDQTVQNQKQKVIDVSKKKNKIEINPNMSEECGCDEKEKETPVKDMRELPTKVNLAKTKMRSAGVRNPIVMVGVKEDWQSVNRKDKTDGLSQKAVNAYRRENPGSKLQTAVTEKKPTGKRAERRKSFCSRMNGMKDRLTSAETARDPDSRINKALRRWNCN